jgi:hypothetical protein
VAKFAVMLTAKAGQWVKNKVLMNCACSYRGVAELVGMDSFYCMNKSS